jgi:FKBP-type peptidyl-prolyl cis-trans isomerase FkpA
MASLSIEDLVVGQGDTASSGQHVTVHYTGWLDNNGNKGAKFDSSRDRNEPFTFPLGRGQVIKGWDDGVQGMRVGGRRQLTIPSAMAYGARGAGNVIKPHEPLVFVVDLLAVE